MGDFVQQLVDKIKAAAEEAGQALYAQGVIDGKAQSGGDTGITQDQLDAAVAQAKADATAQLKASLKDAWSQAQNAENVAESGFAALLD